jgi:putative toxin-antitoxin system antitoxin component (TIGR02293 family)
MTTEQVVAVLGGEKTLRRKVSSPMKLIETLRKGLPYPSLESLMRTLDLSRQEAAATLSVPLRTLARRKKERRLRAEESDRLCRLARVAARAIDVLGSVEVARRWLRRPNRALGGVVPLELLDTEMGAEEVEHVLGRIEYGGYS